MQRDRSAASGPCHRAVEAVQVHEAGCVVAGALQLLEDYFGILRLPWRVNIQLEGGATHKAETRYPLCCDTGAKTQCGPLFHTYACVTPSTDGWEAERLAGF
jgi:hypothetical protein